MSVAAAMSSSPAFCRTMSALLALWLVETSRTVVTPQNIACFGPISSELPQIWEDASMLNDSRPPEPPTTSLFAADSH